MAKEILKCQCGQKLTRPIPSACPKCGGKILGVRQSRSLLPLLLTLASIIVMVGLLLLLILFLVKMQQ